MNWKPARSAGGWVGVGLTVVLTLTSLGLLWLLTTRPISIISFALALAALIAGALAAGLGYWTAAFFTLRYRVDRNGIVITWGVVRQTVPAGNIERLAPGVELAPDAGPHGFRWPGYYVGAGHDPDKGPVLFYATRPRPEQLLVVTPTLTYAISPRDPAAFEMEYELRSRLGPTVALTQGVSLARVAQLALWRDRGLWLVLGLAILANALLFGYVSWQYLDLPELLPLHFSIQGQVDRIGERGEVFLLPMIGLIVLIVNALFGSVIHERERLGAYLLWGAALAVQLMLWLATANIILRALRPPTL